MHDAFQVENSDACADYSGWWSPISQLHSPHLMKQHIKVYTKLVCLPSALRSALGAQNDTVAGSGYDYTGDHVRSSATRIYSCGSKGTVGADTNLVQLSFCHICMCRQAFSCCKACEVSWAHGLLLLARKEHCAAADTHL